MDIELIHRFQGIVNENGYALFRYRNEEGRNRWNCICSAMDWIIVSVEYINRINLVDTSSMDSIDVFAYLSTIDIIVEAVEQLNRVIHHTPKELFANSVDIFAGNRFGQNDVEYFKTLRSCFGAHPVNLREPGQENNDKLRRFASWSTNAGFGGDFSVVLYSNQSDKDHIFLSIDLQQVLRFGKKYYEHLTVLGESLRSQYETFAIQKRTEKILSPEDPLEHLEVLLRAAEERLNNDVYRTDIQELQLLFSTEVTCPENRKTVDAYRNALLSLIAEMHEHLQNMDFTDLDNYDLLYLSPKGLPNGWGYYYEKLTEVVFGGGYAPFHWEPRIKELFGSHIKL